MHFEILVEDASGKIALEHLVPKILGSEHTFKIISYKGIGRLPKNLQTSSDPSRRILLENLPRLLRGYGKSHQHFPAAVVVVVDLDDKDCLAFKQELVQVWEACDAIYQGGSKKLFQKGFPHIGIAKCAWAEKIAPHVDVDRNRSPSFRTFRDGLRRLADDSGAART